MAGIDWEHMKEDWVNGVIQELIPTLLGDVRFSSGKMLTDKFNSKVGVWRTSGRIRPLIEIGNELVAAKALLDHANSSDRLEYEPRMTGTGDPKANRLSFDGRWRQTHLDRSQDSRPHMGR